MLANAGLLSGFAGAETWLTLPLMADAPNRNDPSEWNLVASAYEEVAVPFMVLWAEEAVRVAKLLPEERVLDVATGPGTLALQAAPKVREVVAVDYAEGMLGQLKGRIEREGVKNVEARKMNGQQLELASESFDAAFSLFGLNFFPDRKRGFRELYRVLKPKGRAIVVAWSAPEATPLLSAMVRGVREALPDLPPPETAPAAFSLQDPTRFATEMIEAGFDEVEVRAHKVEQRLEVSLETYFEWQARANVMLAGLKQKLPDEEWNKVRASARARMAEVIGDGPLVLRSEANFGIGWREADEDD